MYNRQESIIPQFGNNRMKREDSAMLRSRTLVGSGQVDKNNGSSERNEFGRGTSLLVGAAPEMLPTPSNLIGDPQANSNNAKNRLQFQLGKPSSSRMGANQQNFLSLIDVNRQHNQKDLDGVLQMDSDEEGIVNMDGADLGAEKIAENKKLSSENAPRFASSVRRSARLASNNLSRGKSDISANMNRKDFSDYNPLPFKDANANQERAQVTFQNQCLNFQKESSSLNMMNRNSQIQPIKFNNDSQARIGRPLRNISDLLNDGRTASKEQPQKKTSTILTTMIKKRLRPQEMSESPIAQRQNNPEPKTSLFQMQDNLEMGGILNFNMSHQTSAQKPRAESKSIEQQTANKRVLKGREKVKAVVQEHITTSKQKQMKVRGSSRKEYPSYRNAEESDSDDLQDLHDKQKRRGRKRERDDLYFQKAIDKIKEIREILKSNKSKQMTVKERQRLRNQISAQQSRIRKKEEVIFLNRVTREKDEKFTQLIQCMTQTLDSKDLIAVHKKLSNCWEMSDISYRNIDLGSTKRQKNSYADSQLGESKNAMNSNDTKNGNFPRMTRVQSKNYGVPSMSKDSDMILGNPMDSQYNASLKDNQSVNGEQAVRLQFAQSLLDAFVTKDEEYDQFKQNDEKQYEEDDD